MKVDSAAIDRYITGNYGEDQFRANRATSYAEQRGNFLDSLTQDLIALGHNPFPWTKGAHGFHTHCKNCGMVASCTVSKFKVREFPKDRCPNEPCTECGQIRTHQNHWAPFGWHNFVSSESAQ